MRRWNKATRGRATLMGSISQVIVIFRGPRLWCRCSVMTSEPTASPRFFGNSLLAHREIDMNKKTFSCLPTRMLQHSLVERGLCSVNRSKGHTNEVPLSVLPVRNSTCYSDMTAIASTSHLASTTEQNNPLPAS